LFRENPRGCEGGTATAVVERKSSCDVVHDDVFTKAVLQQRSGHDDGAVVQGHRTAPLLASTPRSTDDNARRRAERVMVVCRPFDVLGQRFALLIHIEHVQVLPIGPTFCTCRCRPLLTCSRSSFGTLG
jgi:hypothetical protein